jgi:hypothetical protein
MAEPAVTHRTLEFLLPFEQYNGANPEKKDVPGDIATFPAEKASRILALRGRGGAEVAREVGEPVMRKFYDVEQKRIAADEVACWRGAGIVEAVRPSSFERLHPALYAKFQAADKANRPAQK